MICYGSAERNKGPILTSLKKFIDQPGGKILEISSGTGQHATYFASNFPNFIFQPTELDRNLFNSIDLYSKSMNLSNVLPPKYLDASTEPDQWLDGDAVKNPFDYVLNINMIHVSEWKCTEGIKMLTFNYFYATATNNLIVLLTNYGSNSYYNLFLGLFKGSCRILKPKGKLFTYGAYEDTGVLTPQSNIDFDCSLKLKNPAWGLRNITEQLIPTASKYGFTLTEKVEMPTNNHFLVWSKLV